MVLSQLGIMQSRFMKRTVNPCPDARGKPLLKLCHTTSNNGPSKQSQEFWPVALIEFPARGFPATQARSPLAIRRRVCLVGAVSGVTNPLSEILARDLVSFPRKKSAGFEVTRSALESSSPAHWSIIPITKHTEYAPEGQLQGMLWRVHEGRPKSRRRPPIWTRLGRMVGVTGFEPATPASRTQCSGQAELHPVAIHFGSGDSYSIAAISRRAGIASPQTPAKRSRIMLIIAP